MLLGIQVPSFTWPEGPAQLGRTLRRIAVDAEAAGASSFWVMDHFFQIRGVGPSENEMLEGYTALGNVAAVTEKITLGTMVTGVTYRIPALLIKTVTTLDVLSEGRAWFGVGAAWNEEEHVGLGVPFPPVAERFERLEETLQIGFKMWSGDESPYRGTHYQPQRLLNSPQSLSRPHPKVLIGGTGEKKTLRLVAKYADACNIFASPERGRPSDVERKFEVLREHCAREGTDYDRIRKTVLYGGPLEPGADGAKAFAEQMSAYAALGVSQAHVMPPDDDPVRFVENLGEHVIPRIAGL